MHSHSITIICALLLSACSGSSAVKSIAADESFLSASMFHEKSDGELVTLRGWVSMRHEDWNLWATWSDHEDWNTTRCISLSGYDELRDHAKDFDGKLVEVTGTLLSDATERGRIVRLGSCREVAIRVNGLSSVRLVDAHIVK